VEYVRNEGSMLSTLILHNLSLTNKSLALVTERINVGHNSFLRHPSQFSIRDVLSLDAT
jgi:hypothetical protein